MTITIGVGLAHLAAVVVVRFLHGKVTPVPFPRCTLWMEVTLHSSHLRSEGLYSVSLRAEYLHTLFGICMGHLSLPTHVFKHLYVSVDSGISITLWVILQYYLILFLKCGQLSAEICAILPSMFCSLDFFFFFFRISLLSFWHCKMLQAHLVCPLIQPLNEPFFQGSLIFHLENGTRNRD